MYYKTHDPTDNECSCQVLYTRVVIIAFNRDLLWPTQLIRDINEPKYHCKHIIVKQIEANRHLTNYYLTKLYTQRIVYTAET